MKRTAKTQLAKPAGTKARALRATATVPATLRTQTEAMAWLQAEHPKFFADSENQRIASVVVLALADELRPLRPVQRTALIAGVMALMHKMATAAIKGIRDPRRRRAGTILADDYKPDAE